MRFLADLGAGLDINLDRLPERCPQFLDGVGMESYAVADSGKSPGEQTVLVVIVDTGRVSLVRHPVRYGVSPILLRNPAANCIDPSLPFDRL